METRDNRQHDAWLASLAPDARIVASTAIAVNANIVEAIPVVGGCYHLSFFLFEYLRSMHGIDVEPVVGWVNDGRDAVMIPHAWIEFDGKKTDVSLTKTEYPDAQLAGALIVLDEVIRPGEITYTYHKMRTPEALAALDDIDAEDLEESESLFDFMTDIARSPKQIRHYLKSAPPELSFGARAERVRETYEAKKPRRNL